MQKYTILDNLLQKLHISYNPFPIDISRVSALHITKIPRLRMPKTTSIYAHSIGNPCFPMLFLLSSSCRAVAMRLCSILRHILTTERKKPPLSRRTTKVAYSGGSRASSLATAPAIDRYTFSIGGGITPAAGGRIPVFSHGRTMQAPVFFAVCLLLLYYTILFFYVGIYAYSSNKLPFALFSRNHLSNRYFLICSRNLREIGKFNPVLPI